MVMFAAFVAEYLVVGKRTGRLPFVFALDRHPIKQSVSRGFAHFGCMAEDVKTPASHQAAACRMIQVPTCPQL